MSWDLRDKVPLSVEITDADGNPADAGSVSATITLPDGTTTTVGPIASTTPGVYGYDYATVQAGRHNVYWVASGVNACSFSDAFDVTPADDGTFISLDDARDHLKKTAADDEKLRGFVSAACRMIEDRIGHVTPVTLPFAGQGRTIILERPVIAVIAVVRVPGGETVPEADPGAGTDGWTLDAGAGVLTLSRSYGRVSGVVRVGRTPVPGNLRLAGLELTGHLWRTSQHNMSGGRPSLGVDETIVPGVSYALPYNVRQLLGLDKRPREEVLVG